MALYERQSSLFERLGKMEQAEALHRKMQKMAGLSDAQIAQQAESIRTAQAQAEITRVAMEKWAAQMQSGLFPGLAEMVKSNFGPAALQDTNSPQSKRRRKLEQEYKDRGFSKEEADLALDQNKAMQTMLEAFTGKLQGRDQTNGGAKTVVPRSKPGLDNEMRQNFGEFVSDYPKLMGTARKTNDSSDSVEVLESWFQREWESWNRRFEDGTPLNRLVGEKQYSAPLLRIPGNAVTSGAAMGLLALNLKGLLLDREFRLQTALPQSKDPAVAAWREKLWQLQIESLRSRPQPVDPAEESYSPKQPLKNSPFTLVANDRIEAAQRDLRVLGLALPGVGRRLVVAADQASGRLPAGGARSPIRGPHAPERQFSADTV